MSKKIRELTPIGTADPSDAKSYSFTEYRSPQHEFLAADGLAQYAKTGSANVPSALSTE